MLPSVISYRTSLCICLYKTLSILHLMGTTKRKVHQFGHSVVGKRYKMVWNTVCVQIFAGRIFRKRPAPNNIRDFDMTNGSLQLQTCTVCLQIFAFSFSRLPVDSRNSQKYSPAKICTHTVLPCCTVLYQNSTILHSLSVVCSNH